MSAQRERLGLRFDFARVVRHVIARRRMILRKHFLVFQFFDQAAAFSTERAQDMRIKQTRLNFDGQRQRPSGHQDCSG
jgi:hypothetical protein